MTKNERNKKRRRDYYSDERTRDQKREDRVFGELTAGIILMVLIFIGYVIYDQFFK